MIIDNKRQLVRRTTTTGLVPTAPDPLSVTSVDIPDNTWLTTDVMVGELFANVTDGKIWFKGVDDTPILLGTATGTIAFTDLTDVPATYVGAINYILRVNTAGDGIEFVDINDIVTPGGASAFTELSDVPSDYTGMAGKAVVVNSTEDGLEFSDVATSLDNITGVDNTNLYVANNILVADGTEYIPTELNTVAVDLVSDQVISGEKSFYTEVICKDGIYATGAITLEGLTQTIAVDDIYTDLTVTSDTTLATSKATKDYVDDQLASYVSNILDENVGGEKSFTDDIYFKEKIYLDTDGYVYFGDATTDGSMRLYVSGNILKIQVRISGTWTDKDYCTLDSGQTITANKIFNGLTSFNNNTYINSTKYLYFGNDIDENSLRLVNNGTKLDLQKYSLLSGWQSITFDTLTNYLTLYGTQTVTGSKTFSGTTTHSGSVVNTSFNYLGSSTTDGSWRYSIVSGNIAYYKRESGVWVWKYSIIG